MAEKDEKTTVATPEAQAAPAKKSNKKLFLFGGIGLGAVVIGAALMLFVFKPSASSGDNASGKKAEKAKVEQSAEKTEGGHGGAKEKKESGKHGEGKGGESLVYKVENIVVNPAGTGGSRFLSVSFGIDLKTEELLAEVESHAVQVRDALITVLSSKTVADLTDPKQKELMRLQIRKRLEQLLGSTDIAGVYYTDFVLQ